MSSTTELIRSLAQLKLLVIGDVMVDSYVRGSVHRISPEAPVPIVEVASKDHRLGGAANVALNALKLGVHVDIIGIIGQDEPGTIFRDLLQKRGISDANLVVDPSRRTTIKERLMNFGHQMLRIDEEDDHDANEQTSTEIVERAKSCLAKGNYDVLIFQDYDKGCLTPLIIGEVLEAAKEAGTLTAVDPKKRHFHNYADVDLFKPNLLEMSLGLDQDINPESSEELNASSDSLRESLGFKNILLTLGKHGVYFSGEKSGSIPAVERNIEDVSGAGDTVITLASLVLRQTGDLEMASTIANIGGGLVCEHAGVVPIDVERLIEEAEARI